MLVPICTVEVQKKGKKVSFWEHQVEIKGNEDIDLAPREEVVEQKSTEKWGILWWKNSFVGKN